MYVCYSYIGYKYIFQHIVNGETSMLEKTTDNNCKTGKLLGSSPDLLENIQYFLKPLKNMNSDFL